MELPDSNAVASEPAAGLSCACSAVMRALYESTKLCRFCWLAVASVVTSSVSAALHTPGRWTLEL